MVRNPLPPYAFHAFQPRAGVLPTSFDGPTLLVLPAADVVDVFEDNAEVVALDDVADVIIEVVVMVVALEVVVLLLADVVLAAVD